MVQIARRVRELMHIERIAVEHSSLRCRLVERGPREGVVE
jgi:hypothetical protein